VSPQSKTVTKYHVRKYDVVRFQSSSRSSAKVKLIRVEVKHSLSVSKEAGYKEELKVVYLKPLKRRLKVSPANP